MSKDMNPIEKLMSQFMGGGAEPDPDEIRANEIVKKLHTDFALKEFAKIDQFIKTMCSDLNGQYEAIAFVRQYLRDACNLPDKVAREQGLPVEVGRVLAEQVQAMIQYSVEDGAASVYDDEEVATELFNAKDKTSLLTEDQVQELETELAKLEETLQIKDNVEQAMQHIEAGDDPAVEPQKNWGTLDPKNPFGLN